MENGFKWKLEYLRVMTPVFLFTLNLLAGILLANQREIITKISDMDNKIFLHLTNDEIHTPRQFVVSKEQFDLYQKMRNDQLDEIRKCQQEIKNSLSNIEQRLYR